MKTRLSHAIARLAARSHTPEAGQALVEYSLIMAFVAIALIGTLGLLTGDMEGILETITGVL
jgi:Flp pilus assembly pilin Flp